MGIRGRWGGAKPRPTFPGPSYPSPVTGRGRGGEVFLAVNSDRQTRCQMHLLGQRGELGCGVRQRQHAIVEPQARGAKS